jgi:hypothetical protein
MASRSTKGDTFAGQADSTGERSPEEHGFIREEGFQIVLCIVQQVIRADHERLLRSGETLTYSLSVCAKANLVLTSWER